MDDASTEKGSKEEDKPPEPFMIQALKLGGCALGLQGSYLTWGVLQEQVGHGCYVCVFILSFFVVLFFCFFFLDHGDLSCPRWSVCDQVLLLP